MWFFCNIILNVNAARIQAGDVYYACHSRTVLKQASLLKSQKITAWFSLASELNPHYHFSLIM